MSVVEGLTYESRTRERLRAIVDRLRVPSIVSVIATHSAAICVSFLIAMVALLMFTRNNDFPINYHPDEEGKARQLLHGEYRNFNHPLLMLEASELMMGWLQTPRDMRWVVITGRFASATLAAAGVLAVALGGYVLYGWAGLLIVGATMALCPSLSTYAHYLKEDATLAAAILVTVSAAAFLLKSRSEGGRFASVVFLGIGCGLTCSSKYVGLAIVVPGLIALLVAPGWRWWTFPTRLLPFLLAGFATVAIVNYRAFDDQLTFSLRDDAVLGIERETEHGTTDHAGLTMDQPNTFLLSVANDELMTYLKVLAGAGLLTVLALRKFSRWSIVLGSFFVTFAIVLAYCPIPFGRYSLPLAVLAYLTCACVIAAAVSSIKAGRWRTITIAGIVLCITLLQGRACARINNQFRNDSRQQLREWAAKNIPSSSRVLADNYAMLTSEGDPWRFPAHARPNLQVTPLNSAADMGTLTQIRRRGYQYLVICELMYGRFDIPSVRGVDGNEHRIENRRKFYREVIDTMEPVWEYRPDPETHSQLSPEIRVYKLN